MFYQIYDYLNFLDQKVFVLFSMIFLHFVSDFLLQDEHMRTYILKENWCKDGDQRYDYFVILIAHSFIWAFLTFIPIIFFLKSAPIVGMVILINMVIHAVVDDLYLNEKKLNILVEQLLHVAQVVASLYIVWGVVY